jgi:hypothetical protein
VLSKVVHDYNPSTREEHEFETSIGYTAHSEGWREERREEGREGQRE